MSEKQVYKAIHSTVTPMIIVLLVLMASLGFSYIETKQELMDRIEYLEMCNETQQELMDRIEYMELCNETQHKAITGLTMDILEAENEIKAYKSILIEYDAQSADIQRIKQAIVNQTDIMIK